MVLPAEAEDRVFRILGDIEKNELAGPWVHETRKAKGPDDAVSFVKGFDCYSGVREGFESL